MTTVTQPIPNQGATYLRIKSPRMEDPIRFKAGCITFSASLEELGKGGKTLRIAIAESHSGESWLRVRDEKTGRPVGRLEIHYPVKNQIFECDLDENWPFADDLSPGLKLEKEESGGNALRICGYDPGRQRSAWLAPQLRCSTRVPFDQFILAAEKYACSNASLTEFGFIEGCLLEAFQPESYFGNAGRSFILHRLGAYLREAGESGLQYGLEGCLPFAAMARFMPDHRELDRFLEKAIKWMDQDACAFEGGQIVAEGNYTLAYPLAVLGRERKDPEIMQLAIRQLECRSKYLHLKAGIALRAWKNGSRTFINWARGVAWYFHGLVQTLEALDGQREIPPSLQLEAEQVATSLCDWQRPDGLWGSYIDDPDTLPDTSGSAGIAAALASMGKRSGNDRYTQAAQATVKGMEQFYTQDGLLGGATQHNCGGEALQRGPYRVYQTYTLGLFLQLLGKLGLKNRKKWEPRSPQTESLDR